MILGMSIPEFTRHRQWFDRRWRNVRFAQVARYQRTFFIHDSPNKRDGISVSDSRLHARIGRRDRVLCDPAGRAVCVLRQAPDRRMALDLCSYCNCSALLECFCFSGAELRKGGGAQRAGANPVRAAFHDCPVGRIGDLYRNRSYRCGYVSAGNIQNDSVTAPPKVTVARSGHSGNKSKCKLIARLFVTKLTGSPADDRCQGWHRVWLWQPSQWGSRFGAPADLAIQMCRGENTTDTV